MANQHAGFCKHFICEETLSRSDSPTRDQDIGSIGVSRGGHARHTPPPMGPNSFIFTEKHPLTGARPPTGIPGSAIE